MLHFQCSLRLPQQLSNLESQLSRLAGNPVDLVPAGTAAQRQIREVVLTLIVGRNFIVDICAAAKRGDLRPSDEGFAGINYAARVGSVARPGAKKVLHEERTTMTNTAERRR
jgi:hypothetical protein